MKDTQFYPLLDLPLIPKPSGLKDLSHSGGLLKHLKEVDSQRFLRTSDSVKTYNADDVKKHWFKDDVGRQRGGIPVRVHRHLTGVWDFLSAKKSGPLCTR